MRALITGGAGFIGSALVRRLAHEPNCSLLILDKLTYAANLTALEGAAARERVTFVHGDIGDGALVAGLLETFRPDVVINLAAESHVDRSIDSATAFVETNVTAVHRLLDAALAHWRALPSDAQARFRVLHMSTDEVFGVATDGAAFTTSTPYDPRSPYAASKAAGDHLVSTWRHTFGLPTLLLHSTNNYGPYQFPEKLIPLIITRAAAREALPVYGDGLHRRDWLHVEDHVEGLWAAMRLGRPGERYLFGARASRTNLEVVHAICNHLDRTLRDRGPPRRTLIRYVADRPGHDRAYAVDPGFAEQRLDWRPQRNFEDGLAQTIDWYLAHRPWWEELRRAGKAGERLGLSTPQRAAQDAA